MLVLRHLLDGGGYAKSRGGRLRGGRGETDLELHPVPQDFRGIEHLNAQQPSISIKVRMDTRHHGLGFRRPLARRSKPEI